jgi:hypothetical protein
LFDRAVAFGQRNWDLGSRFRPGPGVRDRDAITSLAGHRRSNFGLVGLPRGVLPTTACRFIVEPKFAMFAAWVVDLSRSP